MIENIPLKKKLALELFRLYKNNTTKIHQLNYIFWECTLRCNLQCLHCGSDCKKETTIMDMPVVDFLRAIDTLKDLVNPNKTMIVFTGGEPLMRNDLEICGKELYNRGFPWGIVSNGYILSATRLKSMINAGMRAITISLDGLNDSHNWLRGNPYSYSKAMGAIQWLPHQPNLVYDVVTCANRKNIEELNQIKEDLIRIGVKNWRIFTIFPIGRAKENPDLDLSPLEFRQVFEFIKETRKENRIKVNYGCEGFLGNYETEVRDNFFFCRAGINVASILADGSVSACPNMRDNFIQGNIYNDDFSQIWSARYAKFRNKEWARIDECKTCSYFRYCEGNGMHLHDEKTGKLLFCHLNKLKEAETTKQ